MYSFISVRYSTPRIDCVQVIFSEAEPAGIIAVSSEVAGFIPDRSGVKPDLQGIFLVPGATGELFELAQVVRELFFQGCCVVKYDVPVVGLLSQHVVKRVEVAAIMLREWQFFCQSIVKLLPGGNVRQVYVKNLFHLVSPVGVVSGYDVSKCCLLRLVSVEGLMVSCTWYACYGS